MLALLRITALAAAVAATALSGVSQNANFDDGQGSILLTPLVGIYKNLNYTGFGVGAASNISVATLKPSSLQNFAVGPSFQNPLSPLIISTVGTKTKTFDLNYISTGCYAATRNGASAPPIDCTVTLTATKAGASKTEQAVLSFKTGSALGISTVSLPVQAFKLPVTFKGLTSVRLVITKSTLPNVADTTAQLGIDDVRYVTYATK